MGSYEVFVRWLSGFAAARRGVPLGLIAAGAMLVALSALGMAVGVLCSRPTLYYALNTMTLGAIFVAAGEAYHIVSQSRGALPGGRVSLLAAWLAGLVVCQWAVAPFTTAAANVRAVGGPHVYWLFSPFYLLMDLLGVS